MCRVKRKDVIINLARGTSSTILIVIDCICMMCCVEKCLVHCSITSKIKRRSRLIIHRVVVYLVSTWTQNLKFQYRATKKIPCE